jgi:hypothetical protein
MKICTSTWFVGWLGTLDRGCGPRFKPPTSATISKQPTEVKGAFYPPHLLVSHDLNYPVSLSNLSFWLGPRSSSQALTNKSGVDCSNEERKKREEEQVKKEDMQRGNKEEDGQGKNGSESGDVTVIRREKKSLLLVTYQLR